MVLFDISLIFSDTNTHIGGHVTQGAILLPNSSARWTRERGRERKRGSAEHEMRFPSDGPIKATLSVPADPPPHTHARTRNPRFLRVNYDGDYCSAYLYFVQNVTFLNWLLLLTTLCNDCCFT